MAFVFKRLDLNEDNPQIDQIHQDVLYGDCVIVLPIDSEDPLPETAKYLVIDYGDHLTLIYPDKVA